MRRKQLANPIVSALILVVLVLGLMRVVDIALSLMFSGILLLAVILYNTRLFERIGFTRGLSSYFVDFLALLLVFEASGLRLDEVLLAGAKKEIVLPEPYMRLAKIYSSIYKVLPDPYSSLRRLAKISPFHRLNDFINGYSEVLVTTNDTLHYVESFLAEEMARLDQRINNLLSLIDSIYEGMLIVILAVIVYSLLPIAGFNGLVAGLLVSVIGLTAYLLVHSLGYAGYWPRILLFEAATLLFILLSPPILSIFSVIAPVLLILYFSWVLMAYTYYSRIKRVENETYTLLEEIYMGIRQNMPVDYIMIRVLGSLSPLYRSLRSLLLLGMNYNDIRRVIRPPPLVGKLLELVLAPLGYGRSGVKHIGYVLRISELVRGLRRRLGERARIYYLYAFTLPLVLIVFTHSFRGLGGYTWSLDRGFLVGLGLSTTLVSFIVAGKIAGGCGLCSWRGLLSTIAVYLLLLFLV